MVKACQMKDPVESENFDFLRSWMSQSKGVFERNVGGDSYFSSQFCLLARFRNGISCGKREDIRRLVFAAESLVQFAHGGTAGHQHIHLSFKAHNFSRTQHEAPQCVRVQAHDSLFQNHQTGFETFSFSLQ